MSKRILAIISAIILATGMTACGDKDSDTVATTEKVEEVTATEKDNAEVGEKSEDEATEEKTTDDSLFSDESKESDMTDTEDDSAEEVVFEKAPDQNIQFFDIPEGTTKIGYEAFGACYNLDTLTIPNSVKEIESDAFNSCESLKEIDLPESLEIIGDSAFIYSGLEHIHIPDSVKHIGNSAFYECRNLKEANIPSGECLVDKINGSESVSVFEYCSSLEKVTLPDDLTVIPDSMFSYCKSLTTVNIPDSVKRIGLAAFGNCESLTEFSMPSHVEEIGCGALSCTKIKEITIPDTVRVIEANAFSSSYDMVITIESEHIDSLSEHAFDQVKEVRVPQSLLDSLHVREDGFADAYANNATVTAYNYTGTKSETASDKSEEAVSSKKEKGIVGDWYPKDPSSDPDFHFVVNADGTGYHYNGQKKSNFTYRFDGWNFTTKAGINALTTRYYYDEDKDILTSSYGDEYIKK